MWIWNCKDFDWASLWLVSWFVPVEQNPIDMGWKLHERLREKPDDTLCLVAFEKNIIQAVLIAYVRKRDVWLWQGHTRKGFRFSTLMFNLLKNWSKMRNRKKIRIGIYEKKELFQRRWDFKPCRWGKDILELKL